MRERSEGALVAMLVTVARLSPLPTNGGKRKVVSHLARTKR